MLLFGVPVVVYLMCWCCLPEVCVLLSEVSGAICLMSGCCWPEVCV